VALDQNIEHVTILIHSAPEIKDASVAFQKHFVEVPLVVGSRRPAPQAVGISLAELEAPFSNCLIAEADATHG